VSRHATVVDPAAPAGTSQQKSHATAVAPASAILADAFLREAEVEASHATCVAAGADDDDSVAPLQQVGEQIAAFATGVDLATRFAFQQQMRARWVAAVRDEDPQGESEAVLEVVDCVVDLRRAEVEKKKAVVVVHLH